MKKYIIYIVVFFFVAFLIVNLIIRDFFLMSELTTSIRSQARKSALIDYTYNHDTYLDFESYNKENYSSGNKAFINFFIFPHSVEDLDKRYVESYNKKMKSLKENNSLKFTKKQAELDGTRVRKMMLNR